MDVKKIGVFATAGTVNSGAYKKELLKHNPELQVQEIACPNWVSIVEGILKNAEDDIKTHVDEMQKFFPEEKKYINNVRAIQSLEDSAKNGMILLATTRDLDSVDQTLLNSLRFERIVELKMPRKKEILELIENNVPIEKILSLNDVIFGMERI